jgi:RNA polymerase sigma factor (sigma-70 family)
MDANLGQGVLRHIRTLIAGRQSEGQGDGDLLDQFIRRRSDSAFAGLLERHGPMILSVCRRVLRDEHLAEDAFQATFLVLARKAGSIRKRDALASWLHGVALRLAHKLHAQTHRGERSMSPAQLPPVAAAPTRCEEHEILDEELQRLPDRYRLPLVLCYLEGRTHNEAALQLGWSAGQLRGLLDRGRERLRSRLVRRGVTLPVAGAAALLADAVVSAAVPPLLAVSTLKAAALFSMGKTLAGSGVSVSVAALVEGGLQMIGSKKAAMLVLLALAGTLVGGGLALLANGARRPPVEQQETPQIAAPEPGKNPVRPIVAAEPDKGKPERSDKQGPRLVVQTGRIGYIHSLALSSDGKRIVSGGADGNAVLAEVATGNLIQTFTGHTGTVNAVALSEDGQWLATAGSDNTARVWEVATGKQVHSFKGHVEAESDRIPWIADRKIVSCVGFAADGAMLVTGCLDGTARLWNLATGKELRVFDQGAPVTAAFLCGNDKRLITGSQEKPARMWDLETGQEIAAFRDADSAGQLALSRDGQWLASAKEGPDETTVRLWNVQTGKMARSFPVPRAVRVLRLSSDGKWLAAGCGLGAMKEDEQESLRIWDTASGKQLRVFGGKIHVMSLAVSNDDAKIFASHLGLANEKVPSILGEWESADGKLVRAFHGAVKYYSTGLAVARDGSLLATGFQLWDAARGSGTIFNGIAYPRQIVLSSDGRRLVSVLNVHPAAFSWNLTREENVLAAKLDRTFGQATMVASAAISPDNKWLVTGASKGSAYLAGRGNSKLGSVYVWNLASGKEVRVWECHPTGVGSVAVSADGKQVVTGGMGDGMARLWDLATGQEIRAFQVRPSPASFSSWNWVALSNDGKHLAMACGADNSVVLWDLATGKEVRTFLGHTAAISSLAFADDSKSLVTGSYDHTARLWDVATGKEIHVFRGHTAGVNQVALTGNGQRLVTSSEDSTFRVWDVGAGRELCQLVTFDKRWAEVAAFDKEWAVIDAEGRYDCTNDGDVEGLHWVVGKETFPLSQFKDRFYDPGLLAKYMGFNREPLRKVQ